MGDVVPRRPRMGLFRQWNGCALRRRRHGDAAAAHRRTGAQSRIGRAVMELLLILTYTALCYAIFKIFRIPVNQWSLATAALGGIIGIALLLLLMNYNHPYTANARIYFAVTPILPGVRGRVVEVPVEAN